MRSFRSDLWRAATLALTLALVGLPGRASGQDVRDVLSKEISVGSDEGVLRLGLSGDVTLEIAFESGRVTIDDTIVGSYEAGGALDAAWQTLLGTAVALQDGALARALVAWEPPEGLDDPSLEVAGAMDRALEGALTAPEDERVVVDEPAEAPAASTDLRSALGLLSRLDRLADLAEALEDLDMDELRLVIDEDLIVEAGDEIDESVLVVDGDLEVAGLIRGDVVVIGGDVVLLDGGRITGELRHADGSVVRSGGEVDGEIRVVESVEVAIEREVRDRVRDEVRRAVRAESRSSSWRPLRRVVEGLSGALGNLFMVLVLGIIGGVILYFAGPNLDAIAETARRTPGRAALVGTAGAFLAFPAWILGIIALAISIIGIPVLILWVPLFPVAVILAAGMGYIAVARNLGTWVARQRYPFFDWVKIQNPYSVVFGGLLVLSLAFVAASLISIVPFLGVLEGLLITAGVAATAFAVLIGFGAFILTRGGRRPEYWSEEFFTQGATPSTSWDDLKTRPDIDEPTAGTAPGAGPAESSPAEPPVVDETPADEADDEDPTGA